MLYCSARCSSVAVTCGRVVLGGVVSLTAGDAGMFEVTPAVASASLFVCSTGGRSPGWTTPQGVPAVRHLVPVLGRRCCVAPCAALLLITQQDSQQVGVGGGGWASYRFKLSEATMDVLQVDNFDSKITFAGLSNDIIGAWRWRYSSSNGSTELQVHRQASSPII